MNRKVIALVEDPFWRTKIDNAAKSVGASTVFLSDPAGALREMLSRGEIEVGDEEEDEDE